MIVAGLNVTAIFKSVTRLIRVAFLAPDIVTTILSGSQPPQLTASRLMESTRLPLDWPSQRELVYS